MERYEGGMRGGVGVYTWKDVSQGMAISFEGCYRLQEVSNIGRQT